MLILKTNCKSQPQYSFSKVSNQGFSLHLKCFKLTKSNANEFKISVESIKSHYINFTRSTVVVGPEWTSLASFIFKHFRCCLFFSKMISNCIINMMWLLLACPAKSVSGASRFCCQSCWPAVALLSASSIKLNICTVNWTRVASLLRSEMEWKI